MSRKTRRPVASSLLLLLPVIAALSSCSELSEYYCFDKSAGVDDLSYHFEFEMKDFPETYDVSFYTRVEGKNQEIYEEEGIPLSIVLTSPSGKKYSETFEFRAGGRDKSSLYRTGVSVSEPGIWKMDVEAGRTRLYMTGLGLYIERN